MDQKNEQPQQRDGKSDPVYRVLEVRDLSDTAYVVRINRNELRFTAGQHILLGEAGKTQMREYSIYSGEQDDHIEVLVREVKDGLVSKRLRRLKTGDLVQVEPPVGFFTLPLKRLPHDRFLFIASGTGIAPFHSFIRSNSDLDYTLLHGVRHGKEDFGSGDYDKKRYIQCSSRDRKGRFSGRVTDYLKKYPDPGYAMVFLCGSYDMILEAMDILRSQGYKENQMTAEVYF